MGIGVYPNLPLEVNGSMRLHGLATMPGIWFALNNDIGYMGLIDDGSQYRLGWTSLNGTKNFSLSPSTGALQVNGSEGNPGSVLQSNGHLGAADWVSPTNALFNNTISKTSTTTLSIANNSFDAPGMTHSFTVNSNTKVFVSFSLPFVSNACSGCAGSAIDVNVKLDGAVVYRTKNFLFSGGIQTISASKIFSIAPGTHTISLSGFVGGSSVTLNSNCCGEESNMNIIIIQQ